TAPPPPTNPPVPAPGQPDLAITEFYVDPASVAYGGSAQATFTIRNAGSAPAGDCRIQYTWTASGPGGACERRTGPLPAGAEITLGCTAGPFYASYNTYLLVDTGALVAESNEDNNWAGFMVNVAAPALPDLTIEELSLNPWPYWGNESDARITVANYGSGDAGSFTLYYWWGDTQRCEFRMDPLPAGAEVTTSCHVGPFWYPFNTYAIADVISEVAESNEDNNRRDLYVEAG
ncbi:MAG TPA: CARDB domain-containing protein, partial [Anaerolineae bacterium]|nr:CARDB domain-containing protein [Anaerolineae bacterium]